MSVSATPATGWQMQGRIPNFDPLSRAATLREEMRRRAPLITGAMPAVVMEGVVLSTLLMVRPSVKIRRRITGNGM